MHIGKKNCLVFFLILIECLIIIFIVIYLFIPRYITNRNPLPHSLLTFVPNASLRYYYTLPKDTDDRSFAPWLPEKVTYHYNKDGLADTTDYPVLKDSRTYRIMTLGDSFVFGMWVNTKDTFSKRLETLLNTSVACPTIDKFEVINLGAPGFDLQYALQRFNDIGAKYSPDFVIWFMREENLFMNMDIYREREEFYKKELLASGSAEKYHVRASDPYAASSLSYAEYMDRYTRLSLQEQDQFIQPELSSIQTFIKQYSLPLLLLTLTEEEERYKSQIKSFATNTNVEYEEIGGVDTFAPNDYHPNVQGHQRIADLLFQHFRTTVLNNCTIK